jgi:hypothetical protein
MAIHKLTDLKVKTKIREIQDLAFSTPKNALVGDGQGLYLSIAKNGTASWLFRYMDHGKAKSVGLGAYPGTSLQKAREKAQTLRDARAGGVDPMKMSSPPCPSTVLAEIDCRFWRRMALTLQTRRARN